MPDRILRAGILSSEPVCSLSWPEEVFYRRLHSIVDDFGRYSADPRLIRAAAYPLQLDKVSDSDVSSWLASCERAGLVSIYSSTGKRFVEVTKFNQRLRAKRSKWPEPETRGQMSASGGQMTAGRGHMRSEAESESKSDAEAEPRPQRPLSGPVQSFQRPSLAEVRLGAATVGFKGDPEQFFAHYEAVGWMDGQGRPLLNWKAKMRSWTLKDAGKKPGKDDSWMR